MSEKNTRIDAIIGKKSKFEESVFTLKDTIYISQRRDRRRETGDRRQTGAALPIWR